MGRGARKWEEGRIVGGSGEGGDWRRGEGCMGRFVTLSGRLGEREGREKIGVSNTVYSNNCCTDGHRI